MAGGYVGDGAGEGYGAWDREGEVYGYGEEEGGGGSRMGGGGDRSGKGYFVAMHKP